MYLRTFKTKTKFNVLIGLYRKNCYIDQVAQNF